MSATIYIGGWARFREECGVTKKEPVEDFSWMGRQASEFHNWRWTLTDAADYEECREALAKVEGAREYLKTYVANEEGEGFNFNDPIGDQIVLGAHHSGGSYYTLLWDYHRILNDWDGWVLRRKEQRAFEEYRKVQVNSGIITALSFRCSELLDTSKTRNPDLESELLTMAAMHGLHGSVEEIYSIVSHLFTEHMARMALEREQEKKQWHHDIIGGLKWKYKHPSRWFDTPWGSTIFPITPQNITEEAYAEMETKYPGYRQHIQRVKAALESYSLPYGVTRYSLAGEKYTADLLARFQLSV
jgi:hypothetical protein